MSDKVFATWDDVPLWRRENSVPYMVVLGLLPWVAVFYWKGIYRNEDGIPTRIQSKPLALIFLALWLFMLLLPGLLIGAPAGVRYSMLAAMLYVLQRFAIAPCIIGSIVGVQIYFAMQNKSRKLREYVTVLTVIFCAFLGCIAAFGMAHDEFVGGSCYNAYSLGFNSVDECAAFADEAESRHMTLSEYSNFLMRKKEQENARVAQEKADCERKDMCRKDVECWGKEVEPEATYSCEKAIEKYAKYNAKWTDGWLENKFSAYRWADESRGVVTLFGDKAQFQNGFGAYVNMIYGCTWDPEKKEVVDVQVMHGSL